MVGMSKPKMTELEAETRAKNTAYHCTCGWLTADAEREPQTSTEQERKKYAKMLLENMEHWYNEKMEEIREEYDIEA